VKNIAVIPARFAASRFPGKLMQRIGEKTIIRMVYENAVAMNLFDEVLVVTDSDEIMNEIIAAGGAVTKSTKDHQSGSDRIAEAIASMDVDVVVNIQGDEPFVEREPLQNLLNCFSDPAVAVASVMKRFGEGDEPENPNQVKVVCNYNNDALYFSRSPIPFKRNRNADLPYFKHVGVYAYRKETLLNFTQWPMGTLEQAEMLEQLRYLENGVAIRMVETKTSSIGIDTPEDLERARVEYKSSLKGF
jgi:3-deoxy-manno-octulosonate cytidylyltransferase (CMP-KDO synthetase)